MKRCGIIRNDLVWSASACGKHSNSLDTLLYVRFAIQNLEFYEWKLGDYG